ncbi:hypothetical protein DFS34DRAFT_590664 [Phlyctochytrium arcticum]|nr:hypothetical protein DFS34DRAFT_590664 [Phlyctochytrium arcticum]
MASDYAEEEDPYLAEAVRPSSSSSTLSSRFAIPSSLQETVNNMEKERQRERDEIQRNAAQMQSREPKDGMIPIMAVTGTSSHDQARLSLLDRKKAGWNSGGSTPVGSRPQSTTTRRPSGGLREGIGAALAAVNSPSIANIALVRKASMDKLTQSHQRLPMSPLATSAITTSIPATVIKGLEARPSRPASASMDNARTSSIASMSVKSASRPATGRDSETKSQNEQNPGTLIDEYISNLKASSILVVEKLPAIMWEKKSLLELRVKERLTQRILDIATESGETAREITRISGEKAELSKNLSEWNKKRVTVMEPLLLDLFNLLHDLTARKQEHFDQLMSGVSSGGGGPQIPHSAFQSGYSMSGGSVQGNSTTSLASVSGAAATRARQRRRDPGVPSRHLSLTGAGNSVASSRIGEHPLARKHGSAESCSSTSPGGSVHAMTLLVEGPEETHVPTIEPPVIVEPTEIY